MKKSRVWTAAFAAMALTVGISLMDSPAHAAPSGSVVDNGDGTATVSWSGYTSAGDVLVVIEPSPPYTIRPNSGTTGNLVISEGMTASFGAGSAPLPAGDYTIKLGYVSNPGTYVAQSSGTITIGGGGGAPTDAAASAPAEVSLSLDLAASGASCKEGSAATGVMGAWLFLPTADDCSSTTNPDAKLLGWSTSANFPVERAQSQVDNRWGAIDEVFDGIRMIFIPAGQATFISGSNSLYPIWAN